jgi:deoxycytidylate deaminase
MKKEKQYLTAVIYDKRGRVLSIGKNNYTKSHPYQAECAAAVGLPEKIFLHAEIDAIIRCKDLTKAHSIHIFRTGKSGSYLLAKPCPACANAISKTPIKQVMHT